MARRIRGRFLIWSVEVSDSTQRTGVGNEGMLFGSDVVNWRRSLRLQLCKLHRGDAMCYTGHSAGFGSCERVRTCVCHRISADWRASRVSALALERSDWLFVAIVGISVAIDRRLSFSQTPRPKRLVVVRLTGTSLTEFFEVKFFGKGGFVDPRRQWRHCCP